MNNATMKAQANAAARERMSGGTPSDGKPKLRLLRQEDGKVLRLGPGSRLPKVNEINSFSKAKDLLESMGGYILEVKVPTLDEKLDPRVLDSTPLSRLYADQKADVVFVKSPDKGNYYKLGLKLTTRSEKAKEDAVVCLAQTALALLTVGPVVSLFNRVKELMRLERLRQLPGEPASEGKKGKSRPEPDKKEEPAVPPLTLEQILATI